MLPLAGNLGWTEEICCSAVRACLHSTSSSLFLSFKEMGGDKEGELTVCVCEGSQVESQFSGTNLCALSALFGNLRANRIVNVVSRELCFLSGT